MNYQQEGYQRGPIHVGTSNITWRAYGWNQEQIDNYIKMRDGEDFELLGVVDASVYTAMEALGGDLEKYLEEAGEKVKKPEEIQKKPLSRGPFISLFKGFGELTSAFMPAKSNAPKKPAKKDTAKSESEAKTAQKQSKGNIWISYKNFKKSHEMISW
jgi:hypothetical protein